MANSIPNIPDDAPFNSEQRAWLNSYLSELVKGLGSSATPPSNAAGKPRALLLHGSQSGNAQAIAEGYAEIMSGQGWAAEAVSTEDHKTIDLTQEPLVLVVISTWGEGDPPDTALEFWEKLKAPSHPKLPHTRFSVLALGDTNYADFCEMGKLVDARFEALGAQKIAPRVDCDVEYEEPAEKWFQIITSKLDEIGQDVFVTTVTGVGEAEAEATEDRPFSKKNPFPSTLKHRYRLNFDPSPRDTRHLELCLEGSGLEYEVGDAIATYSLNDPDLVDEILRALPFNTSVSVETKDKRKLPLREALVECYDIRTVTKAIIKKWAPLTCHPYLHAVIEDDEQIVKILDGIEIIDLLYEFPADFKSGQDFVNLLRRLTPRLYSIASSPKKHPGEVHLTVAKVTYETKGRVRKGVASTYLCEGIKEGETVRVFTQPTKHFKLPTDLSRDIIMVGPGTGIAPFRSFLEEREFTEATGRNWLLFGNPHEETDYFYKEEFDAMQKSGVLTRLDLAWSRDQEHKIYVQDRLWENGEELWKWLENGAHFYVCGDAQYMAPDVEKALLESVRRFGGMDDKGAAAYLKKLKEDHRYQRDVY